MTVNREFLLEEVTLLVDLQDEINELESQLFDARDEFERQLEAVRELVRDDDFEEDLDDDLDVVMRNRTTVDQAEKVKWALFNTDHTQRHIADTVGVSPRVVNNILHERSHRDVAVPASKNALMRVFWDVV